MLPQKNRLNLRHSKSSREGSSKILNEDFTILYKSEKDFKLGIVITKKVATKAVDRNRIKRTISESFNLIEKPKAQVVIIVKKNVAGLKSQEVANKIKELLVKI